MILKGGLAWLRLTSFSRSHDHPLTNQGAAMLKLVPVGLGTNFESVPIITYAVLAPPF